MRWMFLLGGLVLLTTDGLWSAAPAVPPASAPAVSIAVLNVDIWPEHDDPRVLVIYRGQLSGAAPLPYTLTFEMPSSGQVNAAAYRSSEGALLSTDYQYRQDGDRLRVTFTIPERAFQFEYYADLIEGRPQRSMAVDVVFPLPVETMRVSVEQPLRSTAFVLTPPAQSTIAAPAGLTHHLYTVLRWPANKPWRVRATYQKADEIPSLPRGVAAPAGAPLPRTGPGVLPLWAWVAAVAALLGVGSLVAFLRDQRRERARRVPAPASVSRRLRSAKPAGAPKNARRSDSSAPVYCTTCGHRTRRGDRFCSRCGSALPRD